MKLSMACVAAALSLSAAACVDDVGTSGDSTISVKDTNYKANQDPKTRAIRPGTSLAAQLGETHDFFLIRFPDALGITAESLPPTAMARDTSGFTPVAISPANAAAPFHRDGVMNKYTDCIPSMSPMSLTMAKNQPKDDIGGTNLTNAMNHDTTGIQSAYVTLIVQHNNNGTTDTATVMLEDGTFVCQIVQTQQAVISNTCTSEKKPPPPPVGGGSGIGVGSC